MHSLGVVLGAILLGENSILGFKQGKIAFPKGSACFLLCRGSAYSVTMRPALRESWVIHCSQYGWSPARDGGTTQPQGVCVHHWETENWVSARGPTAVTQTWPHSARHQPQQLQPLFFTCKDWVFAPRGPLCPSVLSWLRVSLPLWVTLDLFWPECIRVSVSLWL